MSAKAYVVFVSVPDARKAKALAQGLIRFRLAACVSVLPAITSIYRWDNRAHRQTGSLLLIKTTSAKFKALERWTKAHHPDKIPEILALPVTAGSKDYLDWLSSTLK